MSFFRLYKWLIILCVPLIFLTSGYGADDSVSEQLEQISTKLESNQAEINRKQRAKQKAEADLGLVKRKLLYTELKLRKAKTELEETTGDIRNTHIRVVALERTYTKKRERFIKRIQAIYKQGYVGWLGLILAPEEMEGLEDTSYYFERLVKEDIKMIKSLQKTREDLLVEKKKLERRTRHQRSVQSEIAKQEQTLEERQQQQSKYIVSLQRQIETIEAQNRELEKASERLESFINDARSDDGRYYGTGRFLRPVKGWISSPYGMRRHPISKQVRKHNGMDFASPSGHRILAADSGVVIVAGQKAMYRGYGKVTVIDHGKRASDGTRISTVYAHQSRILVQEGEFVKKGREIGWVGSTGYSTGPHLHFEVRENGRPVDPMNYLE